MRVKTKWHRKGAERDLKESASVLAFVGWRGVLASIHDMEEEGFVIGSPEHHFQVAYELVAFLIQGTDRYAFRIMEEEARNALIQALAKRLIEVVAENQWEILGPGDYLERLPRFLNQRLADYAELTFTEEGPGYSALRYLGEQVAAGLEEAHRKWVMEQVIEVEGPKMWEHLTKALRDQLPQAAS